MIHAVDSSFPIQFLCIQDGQTLLLVKLQKFKRLLDSNNGIILLEYHDENDVTE